MEQLRQLAHFEQSCFCYFCAASRLALDPVASSSRPIRDGFDVSLECLADVNPQATPRNACLRQSRLETDLHMVQ
jgi:hypothetical protein